LLKLYLIFALLWAVLTDFVNECSESQHGGSARMLFTKLQYMSNSLLGRICCHGQACQEHVSTFMADQIVSNGMAHDFSTSAVAAVRQSVVEILTERGKNTRNGRLAF